MNNSLKTNSKRAVLYLRVSTDTQYTKNQQVFLEKYATQNNMCIDQVYEEQEGAWRAGHQKELSKLLLDARKRKFDTVLVWAPDRLSREVPLVILSLVNGLGKYGVRVISYQESWTEATGELADLLYALVGWVARMESRHRSERIKAGLERLKAQGKQLDIPQKAKDKKKRKRRKVISEVIYYQ